MRCHSDFGALIHAVSSRDLVGTCGHRLTDRRILQPLRRCQLEHVLMRHDLGWGLGGTAGDQGSRSVAVAAGMTRRGRQIESASTSAGASRKPVKLLSTLGPSRGITTKALRGRWVVTLFRLCSGLSGRRSCRL
jgi:hypothetical protein